YTYQKRIKSSELLALEEDEKPIFVNDTIKMQNAEGDFIDIILHYEMEDILDEKKTQFFQEKISSFIYYPIYFRVLNYEKFIGYAYLPAILPNRLKPEIIDLMKEVELKITQVILDSHTVMVEDKQAILNYSENGLQFLIKNKTIAQGIIVKPSFSVDITFKLQPPIRLAIMAKNIYKIEDVYYIGGEIIGATNDPIGLDKYRNSINEQRN
ncbi:MAG: hypothetical protein KDK36_07585, partial [Leptospiraceae bacterium]|nr:hypothetical protein [Leptospiraceae bacterium]